MVIIKTEGLSKTYKGYKGFLKKRRVLALEKVNLKVRKGEVFGLLGLNATGKSTLLKMLLGFVFSDEGKVEILKKEKVNSWIKQRIGFLPEDPCFYEYLSAYEFLVFLGKLFKVKKMARERRIKDALSLVGLTEDKKTRIKEFSKGMSQRLGIAATLINNPEILLLDEPMSGLDPLGRKRVKDIILTLKRDGKTVFFSSHILSEVEEICDRIGIIHKGKLIYTGEIKTIKEKGEGSLEKFFIDLVKRFLKRSEISDFTDKWSTILNSAP
ncbi:MAG: ABC transporter ATP-binding protein [Candidatus Aerophobetes bacterium]|nr:ABC transporter ATP-binding protein [Candidatus Aerophobetes bacterium]